METRALRDLIEEETPHNRLLGLRLVHVGPAEASCLLPYAPALAGDRQAGPVHTGAIAALIDVTCGAAVLMRLGRRQRIATLELRVDHLRPATPVRAVSARAECLQIARSVAFVRALADEGDGSDPVASAQGTFVLLEE